jgi:hypothetical protein
MNDRSAVWPLAVVLMVLGAQGCGGSGVENGAGGSGGTSTVCDETMDGDEVCALGDADAPVCVAGRCVACRDATSCEGDTPLCTDNACTSCGAAGPSDGCAMANSSKPVCTSSGECVECTDHEQCASLVCDRDGQVCVPEESIIYVANGGFLGDQESGADTPGCGIPESKCASINFAVENRLDDELGRTWVRIADGNYGGFLSFENQTARLIGGNEVRYRELVQGDTSMALIEVGEGVDLLIDRLLMNPGGTGSIGLRCRGEERIPSAVTLRRSLIQSADSSGAQFDTWCSGEVTKSAITFNRQHGIVALASSQGSETLIVRESIIQDNRDEGVRCDGGSLVVERSLIERNGGGGIASSDASFIIRNNFIQDNGSSSISSASSIGGVRFRDDGPEPRVFEFNTVVSNQISEFTTSSPGVSCDVGAPIEISNSIVWDNSGNREDFAETNPQVSSSCVVAYSNVQGGLNPNNHLEVGPGNIDTDPLFVDIFRGDFRIEPESLAIDAADPDATLDIDFAGTRRPQGDARDIGAHEVVE